MQPVDPPQGVAERLDEARRQRAARKPAEALAAQAGAIALLREAGDRARLAHSLRHQAEMLIEAGRAAEAAPVIVEVLALYAERPPADPLEEANTLRVAALQAQACGDTAGAGDFWRQARAVYARLDARFAPGPNAGVAECDARLAGLHGGESA